MATPRLVHLGIGAFSRAHTLAYTQEAGAWQVAAFTGRAPAVAEVLTAQDGVYGLVVRGPERDEVQRIDVIREAHPADDLAALEHLLADEDTHVVTLTITEKGYTAGTDPATSAPARLARALRARREAGIEAPIALVSCDNLVGNGAVLRRAVTTALEADDDQATLEWFEDHVDVVTTMVDRITPVAGEAEQAIASTQLGFPDRATVVTEPFREWVIEDAFRAEHPAWEQAGARLVPDVAIHETRKLRLLNGAHTYLAYAGQLAGRAGVDEAITDPTLRAQVEQLWSEAFATIDLPEAELREYTAALEERFANRRLADSLRRIAADGSEKLQVRILPVIAERGLESSPAAVRAVAAWCAWVTAEVRAGREVADPRSAAIAEAARVSDDAQRVRALVDLLGDVVDPAQLSTAVLATDLDGGGS